MCAVSRSIHRDERDHVTWGDPKRIDCADKVKPNDVADWSCRQPDWSFLKNVSQVDGFTGFNPIIEGPNRFSGSGISLFWTRNFNGKSGLDSGMKACTGGGQPKIDIEIIGLTEILGRDYGIEKSFRGPSWYPQDLSVVDLRRNWWRVKNPEGYILPYVQYIGMCRWEGYGFQATWSAIGCRNLRLWV